MFAELAREIEFTDRVGRVLKDLGVNHLELGQYEEAQRCFREAKKVADDIQDKELQTLVLISLARLAAALNDEKKAASLLEEAASITDATGDDKSLILICQIKSSLGTTKPHSTDAKPSSIQRSQHLMKSISSLTQ